VSDVTYQGFLRAGKVLMPGGSTTFPVATYVGFDDPNRVGAKDGKYDFDADPWGMKTFPYGWTLHEQWAVRRRSYDSIETVAGVAYDAAWQDGLPPGGANGWSFTPSPDMPGDLHDAILNYRPFDIRISTPGVGTITMNAPAAVPYGHYSNFEFERIYVRTDASGKTLATVRMAWGYAQGAMALVRTGAASLTVLANADDPTGGHTLTGPEDSYAITAGPGHSVGSLVMILSLAGMPAERQGNQSLPFGPALIFLQDDGVQTPGYYKGLYAANAFAPADYHGNPSAGFGTDNYRPNYGLDPYPTGANYTQFSFTVPISSAPGTRTYRVYPWSYYEQVGWRVDSYGQLVSSYRQPPWGELPGDYLEMMDSGLIPPFYYTITVTVPPGGGGSAPPGQAASQQTLAHDTTTGRLTIVRSVPPVGAASPTNPPTLQAEARDGWQGLSGAPARAASPVLDSAGAPVAGSYPHLWKVSESGVYSLVYQDAAGQIVRAESRDGLLTLGPPIGG